MNQETNNLAKLATGCLLLMLGIALIFVGIAALAALTAIVNGG